MVKKRSGGVPYLKTNLKFSWESSKDLNSEELIDFLNKLGNHLNDVGLSSELSLDDVPVDSTVKTSRKRRLSPSDRENGYGFVGLNSVFSGMSSGEALCALFDSSALKASAVSSVLGLYAHRLVYISCYSLDEIRSSSSMGSCSPSTSSYAVPRLNEILSPILKRRGTEAIALTSKSSSMIEVIEGMLVPLSLAGKRERATLGVASTEVSVGKNSDRKKKKQKGRSSTK